MKVSIARYSFDSLHLETTFKAKCVSRVYFRYTQETKVYHFGCVKMVVLYLIIPRSKLKSRDYAFQSISALHGFAARDMKDR